MNVTKCVAFCAVFWLTSAFNQSLVRAAEAPPDQAALDFFERKIRPILVDNCYNCHSANNKADGGLRVDDRTGLVNGGGRGAAVVPGAPDKSILIRAVKQLDDKLKMPPNKKLTDEQIADLDTWVRAGAAWPKVEVPEEILKGNPEYAALKLNHWSWQPLKASEAPVTKRSDWARGDVDRFILAKLESENLNPVADADARTLLRRLTFDLTGLPPTVAEAEAFDRDHSNAALEIVVDRLLASPAFGEKWGRHWLDVARYGESTGSARNLPYPHAWRYRDYVLDAFNKDKPYDQFIREQLAGDLLPFSSEAQHEEQLIATGFLALGVKDVNQRFKVRFVMDNIDEQIDTVSRAVLGLSVSCARCHDHKFDPIPTREYYALAGIFHSTDLCAGVRNKMGGGGLDYYDTQMLIVLSESNEREAGYTAKLEAAQKAVDQAKVEFERLRDNPEGAELAPSGKPKRQMARQKWTRLQGELAALNDVTQTHKIAFGVRDAKQIGDTEIRIRGEAEKLGPIAPRGFLSVLDIAGSPEIPEKQSGRLELAQWLTSPDNPLASRVIVNRVWKHLFGAGLVQTVDNFGITGGRPSHPELLDYLSHRFVTEGWSIKKLIRNLILTHTYQLSSDTTDEHLRLDPDNRWLWRHSPRRLTAEELRDAALVASGQLDRTRPTASAARELKVIEMRNNGPEAQRIIEAIRTSKSRSVYLPLVRTLVPTSLEVFDFAEQGMATGHRDTTTVPTQALYLLNDGFIRQQSLLFAEALLENAQFKDASARVNYAYEVALGRPASASEVARATTYIQNYESQAAEDLKDVFARASAVTKKNQKPGGNSNAAGQADKPVAQAVNPDDVDQTDLTAKDIVVEPGNAQVAAWSSFVQALFGAGEFRYVR